MLLHPRVWAFLIDNTFSGKEVGMWQCFWEQASSLSSKLLCGMWLSVSRCKGSRKSQLAYSGGKEDVCLFSCFGNHTYQRNMEPGANKNQEWQTWGYRSSIVGWEAPIQSRNVLFLSLYYHCHLLVNWEILLYQCLSRCNHRPLVPQMDGTEGWHECWWITM